MSQLLLLRLRLTGRAKWPFSHLVALVTMAVFLLDRARAGAMYDQLVGDLMYFVYAAGLLAAAAAFVAASRSVDLAFGIWAKLTSAARVDPLLIAGAMVAEDVDRLNTRASLGHGEHARPVFEVAFALQRAGLDDVARKLRGLAPPTAHPKDDWDNDWVNLVMILVACSNHGTSAKVAFDAWKVPHVRPLLRVMAEANARAHAPVVLAPALSARQDRVEFVTSVYRSLYRMFPPAQVAEVAAAVLQIPEFQFKDFDLIDALSRTSDAVWKEPGSLTRAVAEALSLGEYHQEVIKRLAEGWTSSFEELSELAGSL